MCYLLADEVLPGPGTKQLGPGRFNGPRTIFEASNAAIQTLTEQ